MQATTYPTAVNPRRLGSLPACVALGSVDIGEATVRGQKVTMTWGRNLNQEKADWYSANSFFEPVEVHMAGQYELILPADQAQVLRGIIS